KEAANAVALHKIHEPFDFNKHCNGTDNNLNSKRRKVKDLCIQLVCHFDKLSQPGDSERNNYYN
ncbi:CYIR protein, partial [Plasmodium cynomolgi strain B]